MTEIQAGFNAPRPTENPYMLDQYARLELGVQPSLADVEPHALQLMESGAVLEGIGLVLGRRVDARDLKEDMVMTQIALTAYGRPQDAMTLLLLKLTAEEAKE
jgi:hypothetical protein